MKFSLAVGMFVITLIIASSAYYFFAYFSPKEKERMFLVELEKILVQKEGSKIDIAEITDFKWDNIHMIVQLDSSWDEGSVANFVKDMGYQYGYLDILYLPRLLKREYEAVFIFTDNKKVTNIIRLDTKQIKVGDIIYSFDPVVQPSEDGNFWFYVHEVKDAPQWLRDQLHYKRQAKITLLKPKR